MMGSQKKLPTCVNLHYPGVGHAFANHSNSNFAPEETADAWKRSLNFLRKYV